MARNWEDNAAEFALLDQGEGWPFARLVACSVEKRQQGGDRRSSNRDYDLKTDATTFAKQAGTSADRVIRYLEAWNRAAERGEVSPADELTPDDTETVAEPGMAWDKKEAKRRGIAQPKVGVDFAYGANDKRDGGTDHVGGGRSSNAETIQRAQSDPQFVQTVMDNAAPEQRAQWVSNQVRNDPDTARAARAGLSQRTEDQFGTDEQQTHQADQRAARRNETERSTFGGFGFAGSELDAAAGRIRAARERLQGAELTEQNVADLHSCIKEIQQELLWLTEQLQGDGNTWDAALKQLTAEQ